MTEGWICPVCGKGLAPWKSECGCKQTPEYQAPIFDVCKSCGKQIYSGITHYCQWWSTTNISAVRYKSPCWTVYSSAKAIQPTLW